MKLTQLLILSLLAGLLGLAQADDRSGPHRLTLSDETWGTLFYLPSELRDYRYTRDAESGRRQMESKLGRVQILETGIGSYTIQGPKETISLEAGANSVTVQFQGKSYQFAHQGGNLNVNTPKLRLDYRRGPSSLTVEGNFGRTDIRLQQGA